MKPLSPTERDEIKARHPSAAPEEIERDIDEYERLLAERFTVDPDLGAAPLAFEDVPSREQRIAALHARLYDESE